MNRSGISSDRLGNSTKMLRGLEISQNIANNIGLDVSIDIGKTVRSGAGGGLDADSTVSGSVLQQHLPAILGFLSNKYVSLRFSAVELIGFFS